MYFSKIFYFSTTNIFPEITETKASSTVESESCVILQWYLVIQGKAPSERFYFSNTKLETV